MKDIEKELKEIKIKAKFRGKEIRSSAIALFLGFTYLIFASTSAKIFQAFQCKTYGDDSTLYLVADKNIDCSSDIFLWWRFYATIMLGVYPLGIPFMYFILLYRKRRILMDEDLRVANQSVISISFLWKMYETDCWWFEVFECGRRLSLTGLLMFVSPGSASQVVVAMILAMISIKVYGYFQPFIEDSDDILAEITQYSIFLTLLSALMLKVDMTNEEGIDDNVLGVALLVINGSAIVMAVVAIMYEPCVTILNFCLKVHVHGGTLLELKDNANRNETREYFVKLANSDTKTAGWERVRDWSSGPMNRNYEKDAQAKAQWRCSYGHGPYDQMRVRFILGGENHPNVDFDDIKKFIINKEHNPKKNVVKWNTLKHLHASEQIIYRVFRVFPLCSIRDAVLDVTNEVTTSSTGRRYIQISRSPPLNEADKIFPKKMSYNLKRRRATILFEGYQVTEVEDGKIEIVFATELNLGGFLTSSYFSRNYYYLLFKWRVSELFDFADDPDFYFKRGEGDYDEENFFTKITRSLTSPVRVAKKEVVDQEKQYLESIEDDFDPLVFGAGSQPVKRSTVVSKGRGGDGNDGGEIFVAGLKAIRAAGAYKKTASTNASEYAERYGRYGRVIHQQENEKKDLKTLLKDLDEEEMEVSGNNSQSKVRK